MKIQEEVTRKFIANNGATFDTEEECYKYEMGLARSTVPESTKYVRGHLYNDGTANMSKLKKHVWKNGNVKWSDMGGTGNVKYAYKFDTFEEAYSVYGSNEVLTLEQAKAATEIYLKIQAEKKKKEQRYVCAFTNVDGKNNNYPTEDGEYITNLGMVWYQTGAGWEKIPAFWMRKVNLTAR